MMHPTVARRNRSKMYRKYAAHQKKLHHIHLANEVVMNYTKKSTMRKKINKRKVK
jgi:hypothetical protein